MAWALADFIPGALWHQAEETDIQVSRHLVVLPAQLVAAGVFDRERHPFSLFRTLGAVAVLADIVGLLEQLGIVHDSGNPHHTSATSPFGSSPAYSLACSWLSCRHPLPWC